MSDFRSPLERTPENVVMAKDPHMPRADYRIIYLPHPTDARITRDEVGKRTMNALCIELYLEKHPRMHVDEQQALEAFKFLEPGFSRESIPLYEEPLHMARAAKARCFFTDMYLPMELLEKEEDERQAAISSANKALMMSAMAGVVAAAARGKMWEWLDELFNKKVDRRWFVGGAAAIAGALFARALPHKVQDLTTPDELSHARISERNIGRKAFRAARGVEESLEGIITPTYLATAILRNLCFVFKSRAAARLLSEDIPGSSRITAVMPMGWGHFGVEEAFKLSDEQLIGAMESIADRINLDENSRASMYSLAEIQTFSPGTASAVIHQLRKAEK